MTESAMDNQVLLRRTLVTAGTMLGGCVFIVGTLTLIALAIVSHAVSPAGEAPASSAAPAITAHGKTGAPPAVPTTTTKAK